MKIFRFLLFPFALIYGLITAIRNFMFDVGGLKSTSFNIPVIAVGNLSVGGTGKTPQIEYLIRLLKNDYKLAILSRGYKRKTKGFIRLEKKHSVEDVGDEPLQYFKKFGDEVIVSVDANRTEGIQELMDSELKPEVILLDDAYQHRKVKAGLYILLTKYNDLYVDDFILPMGNLRESSRGASRADLIIVTKCPLNLSLEEKSRIEKELCLKKNQKLFFSTIKYDEILKGNEELHINNIRDKENILVTGIANPIPLLNYLNEQKITYKHLKFPDHHNFSNADIQKIKREATNGKIILTTEKDFMRLDNTLSNLFYISIETRLNKTKLFEKQVEIFAGN